mgnify:CR=1 FL=1
MPWNSQGGGGWQGGGGPGPWGGRPGGGQQPPDLEELLRRSQEKVKSLFPGGGPTSAGRKGLLLVGLAVLGLWLASGIYTIPEMASIDQTPFTPDVRFQLAPNQKVVARYDDASGHSELLARGRVVGLAKVPKPLVEMILKPGQTFTGEQMLAAAPGVTWESLRVMVTDLFVAGLIVLADVEVG